MSGVVDRLGASSGMIGETVGRGITHQSTYRLTASGTGDIDPITSNIELADSDGYASIGAAMSISSGIWTFPTTGMWWILGNVDYIYDGASRFNNFQLETTENNSTYSGAARASPGFAHSNSSHTYTNGNLCFLFEVTDTSTHKIKFSSTVDAPGAYMVGDTNNNRTYWTTIRIGPVVTS